MNLIQDGRPPQLIPHLGCVSTQGLRPSCRLLPSLLRVVGRPNLCAPSLTADKTQETSAASDYPTRTMVSQNSLRHQQIQQKNKDGVWEFVTNEINKMHLQEFPCNLFLSKLNFVKLFLEKTIDPGRVGLASVPLPVCSE